LTLYLPGYGSISFPKLSQHRQQLRHKSDAWICSEIFLVISVYHSALVAFDSQYHENMITLDIYHMIAVSDFDAGI